MDEAEARENDEFGLRGPDGGETAAPSADDVRRLRHVKVGEMRRPVACTDDRHRPGELDPDPESKPARPVSTNYG